MKVLILCGGFGTRIKDVAEDLPKPMIPIGDRPILWHIMKYYAHFGHTDFILLLGYKSNIIKDYFINYYINTNDIQLRLGDPNSLKLLTSNQEQDWNITFVESGLNSMTGYRIKQAQKYLNPGEKFMLTYGDGLGDIPIDSLIEFHNSHEKTLTLTGVTPQGRFGEILTDGQGVITDFKEKPKEFQNRINGGFFVANDTLFKYIEDDQNEIFEKSPMENLVESRELVQFDHDGFWQPMDTHKEFNLLNDLYIENKAPWKIW